MPQLPSYYSGKVASVGDEEFKALLKRDIPKSGYDFYKKNRIVIHENSTVQDLKYSAGFTGRALLCIIKFILFFVKRKGDRASSNTVVMSVLHQPIRGLAKFGGMSRRQMEGLLLAFNGHLFRGLKMFLTKEKKKGNK